MFDFQGKDVRVILKDGSPWWVAKDVCYVLDISNSRDAIGKLDDDEKGVANTDTLGGRQDLAIINESGLYSLVFNSRKPEAKVFRKWVTNDVLPAIRKTGGYSDARAKDNLVLMELTSLMAQRLLMIENKVDKVIRSSAGMEYKPIRSKSYSPGTDNNFNRLFHVGNSLTYFFLIELTDYICGLGADTVKVKWRDLVLHLSSISDPFLSTRRVSSDLLDFNFIERIRFNDGYYARIDRKGLDRYMRNIFSV